MAVVPGGPDTGDLSRVCLDLPPIVGSAHRVGVGDPYEVLNPPAGWVQIETFTFPLFNQVLVFRGVPPRPATGDAPALRAGSSMGLSQVTIWPELAGERLEVRCLGEAGQREALERACETLVLRACG
jgi:hypothetical protein